MATQASPRTIFAALGSLALIFILAISAHGQCGVQGRTFDQGNLSLGASLGAGNCPGGNCQLPAPVGQLSAPSAGAASASAVAGPQASANGASVEQIVAAVMQQMQAQGYAANAYKPLYLGSGGASAAASASSVATAPMYAPAQVYAPAPAVGLLSYQTLAVPTIPVALASNNVSSASSSASGGGGCSGGRGFFRRASRSRTRTTSNVNGNRSTATSVSVSR